MRNRAALVPLKTLTFRRSTMSRIMTALFLCLIMTGTALAADGDEGKKVVNVFTTRSYEVDRELFKRFEAESGIAVNVVEGKFDELVGRMKNGPEADLFLATDGGVISRAKAAGVLQPMDSPTIFSNIPPELRDPDRTWAALSRRARVIVFSKDRVQAKDLSTYADLAGPQWRGKIVARPQALYDQSLLASFIALEGPAKAEEWVKGLTANFARPPKGNDRQQVKDIAAGLADAALVNTYYLGQMRFSKDPEEQKAAAAVGIIFPDQQGAGTHVNIIGAGLAAKAPHRDEALKLLEFLTGPEAQEAISRATYFYPANPKAKQHEMLDEFGPFKAQKINFSVLDENHGQAVEIMTGNGWE